ncbi:MAG: flagellar biosynthetic protein FliQ [Pseudomonadota bacterium]
MTELEMIALMREATWVGLLISTPILAVALGVGLLIGLLQALTSIQELTLTFVPKLVAILLVFWVSMSFMSQGLVGLFQQTILPAIERS